MTRARQHSAGYRQQAWDRLRGGPWRQGVTALAKAIGCTREGLSSYLGILREQGYLAQASDIELVKNTGPRAPSANLGRRSLHDWNLNPPMTGAQLQSAVRASGLSNAAWLAGRGFSPNGTTRLRQMMNGQRPVSPAIEEAARDAG